MDMASVFYLGVTVLLFLIFVVIVARTYRGKNRVRGEEAKYRMMEDGIKNKDEETAKEDVHVRRK